MTDQLNKAMARLPYTPTDNGDAEYDDNELEPELEVFDLDEDEGLDNRSEDEMELPIGIDEDADEDIDEDYEEPADEREEINFDE